MTNFNLTIGSTSPTRLNGVIGTKYTSAPKRNQFEATVNGAPSPAWTTEGRGSHYVYFKDGDTLYYAKMAGPGELTAARQALVVTTDDWEKTQQPASDANKPSRRRVKKA